MGLFSAFKRKRRTGQASFTSYKNPRFSSRKPFVPKVTRIDNDRVTRHKGQKMKHFLWYVKILLGIVALGGLAYFIFFTSLFEIQNVNVKGEADTTEEQAAIKDDFQKYLGKNLLFFDASQEEKTLLQNYAYLKTININRDFFHTITITLETYPAVANVRMEFDDGSTEYYVINEEGYIASIGTSMENLPLIVMDVTGTDMDLPTEKTETTESVPAPTDGSTPEESTPPPDAPVTNPHPSQINEELIPKEMLTTLLETAKSFEGKFAMQVLEIRYLKRAREIHLYTERLFEVWIDLTQDINLQLEKLKKALTELKIWEAPLEYIDLRISGQNGEKVIYKLSE